MQSDVGPSLLHVLAGGTVCPCCGAPSTATAGPLLTRLNPPPLQAMRMRRPAGFLQSALVVLLMHGVAFGAAEDGVSRVAVNSAGDHQARQTSAPSSSTWPYPGELN